MGFERAALSRMEARRRGLRVAGWNPHALAVSPVAPLRLTSSLPARSTRLILLVVVAWRSRGMLLASSSAAEITFMLRFRHWASP